MSRIRTIKPEFFRHELLQDLEEKHGKLKPMLVFQGLWCLCDREGRFEWKPRTIKLDVLPFIDFNMEETLCLLAESGFLQHYEIEGKKYGAIISWDRHQIVGRDEPPSEIPAPNGINTPYFRPLTQTQRFKIYDADNWTCVYCGRDMHNDHRAACLDHVIPYSKGGTNRDVNMVTSCKKCNAAKGARTPEEAGMEWPKGKGERIENNIIQSTINDTLTYGQPPVKDAYSVPDKEREREREREKEKERSIYTDEFLEFWKAYPRKTGKDAAFNAWKKRNGSKPHISAIITALEIQKKSDQWIRDGGQYIPNPATWINQGRWDDEPPPQHPLQGKVSEKTLKTVTALQDWRPPS